MDLAALARKLALAFASGESNDALAAAVQALFPSAAYVSLCLCGSNRVAVLTSNLAARGFMTQSLMGTERCPCLMTGRPELVPVSRSLGFVPLKGRLLAGRFVCIPIPTMPAAPISEGNQISGLVETPGGMIGCFILGLPTERPQDPGLVSNAANLVRALAAELQGSALRAAQDIVSCVLPVSLDVDKAQPEQPQTADIGSFLQVPASAAQARTAAADASGNEAAAPPAPEAAAAHQAAEGSTPRSSSCGSGSAAACPADLDGSLAAGCGESTAGDTESESSASEHPASEEGSRPSVDSDIGAGITSLTLGSQVPSPEAS